MLQYTNYERHQEKLLVSILLINKCMTTFIPTYLYIKQHNRTGLKYFGKTLKLPTEYKGSGKYWKLHLKSHGDDVTTVWYELFTDKDKLVEYALAFSRDNNIVESNEWANLKPENGLDGGCLKGTKQHKKRNMPPQTPEHKAKNAAAQLGNTRAKALKGRKQSFEHVAHRSEAMKGKNTGPQLPEHIIKRFPLTLCPHCGIEFTPTNYKRWHGDNCKMKKV